MAERREKGLCFNCDQKLNRNHKCGARVFLLLADSEDEFSPEKEELNQVVSLIDHHDDSFPFPDPSAAQLSLHALSGEQAADTFRVSGQVSTQTVQVLVDGGSTHNFLKDTLANSLGLPLEPINPFRVLVGSGQELLCSSIITRVPLLIQGNTFSIDLFV